MLCSSPSFILSLAPRVFTRHSACHVTWLTFTIYKGCLLGGYSQRAHVFMPRCALHTSSICPGLSSDSAADVGLYAQENLIFSTFNGVCIVPCQRHPSCLYTFKRLLLYKVPVPMNATELCELLAIGYTLWRDHFLWALQLIVCCHVCNGLFVKYCSV